MEAVQEAGLQGAEIRRERSVIPVDYIPASKVAPAKPSPPKPCEVCGEPFSRRANESCGDFDTRRSCGKWRCKGEMIRRSLAGRKLGVVAGRHRARDITPCRPKRDVAPAVASSPPGWWDREGCPVAAIYREWVARRAVGAVADIPDDEGEGDLPPLEAAS
jgi:hypothetical protein